MTPDLPDPDQRSLLKEHFRRLFAHLRWADWRALQSVRHLPTEDELIGLLSHVLAAEMIWLTRISRQDTAGLTPWPRLSHEECESLAERVHRGFAEIVEELPDDLSGQVDYRTTAGAEYRNSLADILTHVAIHGAYHRGQIARLLRTSGGEPMNTDFITFAREDG